MTLGATLWTEVGGLVQQVEEEQTGMYMCVCEREVVWGTAD